MRALGPETEIKRITVDVKGIKWARVSMEEIARQERERCTATRGPRSKTRCEIPMPVHNDPARDNELSWTHHMGRGPSGRWFVWAREDSDGES